MSKVCVQCMKLKTDEDFRPYKPRGKYPTEANVGRQTVCKECEALNSGATGAYNAKHPNQALIDDYTKYYSLIPGKVPAIGLRLLGLETTEKVSLLQQVLAELDKPDKVQTDDETHLYMIALRNRSFRCFEEAETKFKELQEDITTAGMLDEAKTLLDDWYME